MHCRLENISQEGTWIESESFQIGDKVVHRKAGEAVGNTMLSWRQLRQESPELFLKVKVWQTPTAFVDSVVYNWQQKEESGRFQNLLRLVDSLRTHWTDQAAETNFLCQAVQVSVPPGCTPLGQVTDTGFAMPGKAAAREYHDELRSVLCAKARSEKARQQYKVGCREILQTAVIMHEKYESLNSQSNTVLAEARACGWFHHRPNPQTGRLDKCSRQA